MPVSDAPARPTPRFAWQPSTLPRAAVAMAVAVLALVATVQLVSRDDSAHRLQRAAIVPATEGAERETVARADRAEQPAAPAPAPGPGPAAAAAPAGDVPPPPKTIAFEGLGTWIDAYDFSREMSRSPTPPVRPEMVDDMAAKGVKTIYLQAAMRNPKAKTAILSPDLTAEFLLRAHAKGIRVVAWYLPRFEGFEHGYDLAFVRALKEFEVQGHRFDAIGLDIEWKASVRSHELRSAILVALSQQVRQLVGPDYPLAAITMPPVQVEVVNPRFWPGYPYAQLAPLYDVWMTMGYWTDRTHSSGWRHSYNYTVENLVRLKAHLGPDVKIHPIGGIGHQSTPLDYAGFVRAAREQGAIGASIYDYATQAPDSWSALALTPSPYAEALAARR